MQSEDSGNCAARGNEDKVVAWVLAAVALIIALELSSLSLLHKGALSWPGCLKLAVAMLVVGAMGYGLAYACRWLLRRFGCLLGPIIMLVLVAEFVALTFQLPWHWVAQPPGLTPDKARDMATGLPFIIGHVFGWQRPPLKDKLKAALEEGARRRAERRQG